MSAPGKNGLHVTLLGFKCSCPCVILFRRLGASLLRLSLTLRNACIMISLIFFSKINLIPEHHCLFSTVVHDSTVHWSLALRETTKSFLIIYHDEYWVFFDPKETTSDWTQPRANSKGREQDRAKEMTRTFELCLEYCYNFGLSQLRQLSRVFPDRLIQIAMQTHLNNKVNCDFWKIYC